MSRMGAAVLEQKDAAEYLQSIERKLIAKEFKPMPPSPCKWMVASLLSPQQVKENEEYAKKWDLPF